MNKEMLIAFNHFDTGGLQTLMVRLAVWGKRNNVKTTLLYKTSDLRMMELCEKEEIKTKKLSSKREIRTFLSSELQRNTSYILMTFELDDYLVFEAAINSIKPKLNIKRIMYIVSNGGAIFSKNLPGVFGYISTKVYGSIVKKLHNNYQIIYMDVDMYRATDNYYGISDSQYMKTIYQLPMFITNEPLFRSEDCYLSKQILTVSRASFPLKGYLVGLIEEFDKLSDIIDGVVLKIISVGTNIEILEKKIEDLPDNIKNNVILIKGLTPSEIRYELKHTKVYVGMGTTVLDACDEGVPAVVSNYSTYKNECNGLFSDNPETLAVCNGEKNVNDVVNNIFELSYEEYQKLRKRTYEQYKKYYDIDLFMDKLFKRVELFESAKISSLRLLFHFLMRGIRSSKRRFGIELKKQNDNSNI